jgi:glycosyltransferase involved in cell wall biosynthesis
MDGKKFYKNGKLKILSASWSSSLYKGFNAIADFSENTDVECVHVGRWNENVDKKNVKLINPLIREDMALAYKDADIFLHAAQNDPCPNVVIEALSSGLPVIYHNSGGTTELAEGYGFPLPIDMNYESINALIGNIKVQYDSIISNIRENLNQFSIATSAEKYLEYLYMVHKNEI